MEDPDNIVIGKKVLLEMRKQLGKYLEMAKMTKDFKYVEKAVHSCNNSNELEKDIQFLFNISDYSCSLEKNFSLLETKLMNSEIEDYVILQPGFVRTVKDQFYGINCNRLGMNIQLEVEIKSNTPHL